MSLCWAARLPGEDAEWLLLQIWAAVGLLPEFVEAEAIAAATESISPATRTRPLFNLIFLSDLIFVGALVLKRLEWGSVRNAALVVDLLAWLYCCSPCKRSSLRIDVGTWLDRQLHQGEAIKHAHVQPILQVNAATFEVPYYTCFDYIGQSVLGPDHQRYGTRYGVSRRIGPSEGQSRGARRLGGDPSEAAAPPAPRERHAGVEGPGAHHQGNVCEHYLLYACDAIFRYL